MANYYAQRIIDGALDYETVVTKKPQYKEGIDAYLISKDRQDLITSGGA